MSRGQRTLSSHLCVCARGSPGRWAVGSLIPRCKNPLGRSRTRRDECRDARTVGTVFFLLELAGIYTPRTASSHATRARWPSTATRTPSRLSLLSGDANDDTDATPVACPTTLTTQYGASPHHARNPTIRGSSRPRYHHRHSPARGPQKPMRTLPAERSSHDQLDPLAEKRPTRGPPPSATMARCSSPPQDGHDIRRREGKCRTGPTSVLSA